MRNAAANFDDDFGHDEPSARKPTRAAPRRRKKKGGRSIDLGRVARIGAVGLSAVVALGIVYNALVEQKGHHPAPLFGRAAPLVQARQTPPVNRAPAAPPAAATARDEEDAPAPALAAKPANRHASSSQQPAGVGDDPIARLLQTGATSTVADKPQTTRVAAAQRALAKLGFAVKASGTMGATTRKALERFEQDRKLPVKGELNRRVIKILSAESGIKIDW